MYSELRHRVERSRCALLVIDVQNAFCHPEGTLGLSGLDLRHIQAAVRRLPALVRWARASGIPDIWTIQEHLPDDVTREAHLVRPHTLKRARIACLPGTWDAAAVDELKPLVDDARYVLHKHRLSCFYATTLDVVLRALGASVLLISGVTSNACVETTIRDAYLRDFDVIAVEDCIGAVYPDLHELATRVWRIYFGLVLKAAELPSVIDGTPPLEIPVGEP